MFIRAAKLFADDVRKELEGKSGWHPAGTPLKVASFFYTLIDGNETSDSPAIKTTETLSLEHYHLLVGYEFWRNWLSWTHQINPDSVKLGRHYPD
jgi:hypothetical protein